MENNTTATRAAAVSTPNTTTPVSSEQIQTTAPAPQTQTPLSTAPQIQAQTPLPAASQTQTQTPTFREKLNAGEEHWIWKLALRGLVLLLSVIGIGCLGWAVQTATSGNYSEYLDDQWYLYWALITFGVSIIWSIICILVLLLRRPNRPVHPGVAVGMDLVLWMAYIPTTMFAAFACVALVEFGANGFINKYSSDGFYTQASNGTWVYNATEYMLEYGQARSCNSSSTYYSSYYSQPRFDTCEEQDAFVNALWQESKKRAGVVLTGTVCQGLVLILHFMLFVWACVDTHRRNKRKTNVDAEKLAADIIGRMVREGAIVNPPGQAYQMQGRYQQLPNQPQGQYQSQQWHTGQNRAPNAYTVHQGPPPPMIQQQQQQQPTMRGALPTPSRSTPPSLQITEHYAPSGNEKGTGLGGQGPTAPVSPLVEHYGVSEKAPAAGPSHAL